MTQSSRQAAVVGIANDPVAMVLRDLNELGLLGTKVDRAREWVGSHADEVREYRANGMKIHEIADLALVMS